MIKDDYLYTAIFRFYEELNDFLPKEKRKKDFVYKFFGNPSIKEAIEGLGVPHTEIDLILANGVSVDFDYHLQEGDRIAVYPRFESLDISPILQLRPEPLREVRFITDVHLGKLARYLRLLGFDTLYESSFKDEEIFERALKEGRIILARDLGILKNRRVTHGTWIRNTEPKLQAREVVRRLELKKKITAFTRCLECNDCLISVPKEAIEEQLLPQTKKVFTMFVQCPKCQRVYWEGSHYDRMKNLIEFMCS